MNYELLYETFPQLKQYQVGTKNKYVFQGEGALFEIPKTQITMQEKNVLSIFLKQLPEQFELQELWQKFVNSPEMEMPEKVSTFQLLKFTCERRLHKIVDFQRAFESIVGHRCYLLSLQDSQFCILIVNQQAAIDVEPYLSLLQDDFGTRFQVFTTELEQRDKLRQRLNLLTTFISEKVESNMPNVQKMDDLFANKMLNSLELCYQEEFCQFVLKKAADEPQLLETVACYIQHVHNFSQTAKALYIHRNTLQKRLDRFEQLSSRDLKCSEDLFKISLAIKMVTMYKMHT